MAGNRKPLSFNVDEVATAAQPAAVPTPAPAAAPRPARAKAAPQEAEERQQVGARIRAVTYRQLKARAALEGRKVQELVELAVEQYLAR